MIQAREPNQTPSWLRCAARTDLVPGQGSYPGGGLDQLVFYLPDAAAREHMQARLAAAGARPVPQIDYWQANGGVTYQDPDGREVVFASWIYAPPTS